MTSDISKADAFRKLANSDRDSLLDSLNDSERIILSKLLSDDSETLEELNNLDDSEKMKKVLYHFRADRYELFDNIKALKEHVDDPSSNIFNISLPGVGSQPSGALGLVYDGDPLDLKNILIDWKKTWKDVSPTMGIKCTRLAVSNKSKPALLELIDADIISPSLVEEVEYRDNSKKYLRGEYDKTTIRPIDVMLKSNSVSVYNAIIEHPLGSLFMKTAKPESCYRALNYVFDTFKTDILNGLLDKGLDPNVTEPDTGRPFICNVSYKASKEDLLSLEVLVNHGMDIRTVDEMGTTPLMQGVKQGLTDFVKFLLIQPSVDLYATNAFKDTILTLAMEGPNRFEERYAEYLLRLENSKDYYAEAVVKWEQTVKDLQTAASESGIVLKDEDLPAAPDISRYTPTEPVKEYPMELMGIVQDAWNAGDPTTSEQYKRSQMIKDDPMTKLADAVMSELGDDFDFSVDF